MSLGNAVDPEALKNLSDKQLEWVRDAWAMEKARVVVDYAIACTNMRYVISEMTERKLELIGESP